MSRPASSTRVALTVVIAMFFIWGFLTSLNDVLVPHLKEVFQLNYAQSMLVQFTFFGAYFVMSLPAGAVVARIGYRNSIVLGLLIAALGALLFYPAAKLPSYAVFLSAFFVLATGITLLQVAANAYVSLLGEPRMASSRLNLAQAFNSLGTTIAPALGGWLILSEAAQSAAAAPVDPAAHALQQAQLVQGPYLAIAGLLVLAALAVFAFRLPPLALAEGDAEGPSSGQGLLDALRVPRLRHGVAAIFLYVGAEVTIGSFLINYLAQPNIGHMSHEVAAGVVSLYWGGAMVGRFIGAALLRKLDPRRVLAAAAASAVVLVGVTMAGQGMLAVVAVVAVGLFNSVMFPTIFTLGIEDMGRLTSRASSLLVMAIVGGAVVPVAQGLLADRIGLQPSFVLPALCYAYIVYYALVSSRAPQSALAAATGAQP